MTIVEIAALLVAVVFAVLVGYLVPVLMQVRKTVAESEQLVAKMNAEMPALVAELRAVSQNLNEVTNQAREGVEHAAVLLHAVGEVGESVQQVHNVVRGSSGTLLNNVASMVAGFKAATHVVRERMKHHKGGTHNGG
ncbi:MAG: DUF948 domain-containing protein [Nitrospira sp.]|jgi:uncharacterized protein YoxC|nr:DUF948 domain-containing protein [Nitrospira sp.]MDH4242862.1 DUF948 domain-containing protein [Nitrospira sp.]MDH4357499.1 DUF948 domain-containing protein [Nitrospira sp.]MDH5317863.1 DUF948 domain-containing protein [Nitrospira sp.]